MGFQHLGVRIESCDPIEEVLVPWSKLGSHLTYANVMATVAVFIALGGSSYAALKVTGRNVPKDALTGADIKNLTGKDVRNNSLDGADVKNLTSADVANGRLLADDFAPGQLPSTHQHANVNKWLAKHPRFHLHSTPTSSSWVNLVERFFGKLTDKAIRRGVFHNVPDLIAAIEAYLEANNENPRTVGLDRYRRRDTHQGTTRARHPQPTSTPKLRHSTRSRSFTISSESRRGMRLGR
jgi:hypothetical protein